VSGAPSHPAPRRPETRRRSRIGEFLVVGGATPLLFVISWLMRETLELSDAEYATGFTFYYAAHLLNDPHFSVTYLLFYEDARGRLLGDRFGRTQKVRYWLAGVVAPLGLGIWAISALATESAVSLGLMFQLMFLLVGWHYVKQGFGVMMVLSARRGIRFTPRERFVILAHAYAGWFYAWASPIDTGRRIVEKQVVYTTVAHPPYLEQVTLVLFGISTVALIVVLAMKRRREGPVALLTPLTGLLCSVWAWSVFSGIDPLVRYAVPALHSLQYLYFVRLLKEPQAREREGPPFFETSARNRLGLLVVSALVLGAILFDLAPMALDETLTPSGGYANPDMGSTPYFAALFTFVNIHHYCMDAVIWRKENKQTRYLSM